MQLIGLLDCNNFFVSCERLFRPDLKGKPVLVLSSNDGCVIARSQEIKDMGIAMGVPYFQIKDMLKNVDAKVFSSHFTLYRDISRRVFSTLKDMTVEMEQYSIDEAFFHLTVADEADALRQLRTLKAEVERLTGIPVSIGLAHTKTQAKYAARVAKKGDDGVAVLLDETWQALAPTIGIGDIWGVGGRLVERYKAAEIATVADLIAAPSARIKHLFGVGGLRLKSELSGVVAHPLTLTAVQQKSIMNSRSFKAATTDIAVIKDALGHHVRQGAAELRSKGILAGVLQVLVTPSRHGDFAYQGFSQEVVLPTPTNDTMTILSYVLRCVEARYRADVPYQKAGVMLGNFVPISYVQPTLFATHEAVDEQKHNGLMALMDTLNGRYDKELLSVGRFTKDPQWQARRDLLSPAYTTRWTDLPIAKAT